MIEHSVRPDELTFPDVLKACSKLRALKEGAEIHAQGMFEAQGIFFQYLETQSLLRILWFICMLAVVIYSLVYMYACCGHLDLARKVFDGISERSAITWSSMLSGYVRCGHWEEVMGLCREKLKLGVRFNEATLISVLTACGRLRGLELGEWIYNYVFQSGLMRNDSLMTSLVDMYAKCGFVDTAFELFDKMYKRML
ncbi:pentatricopeptide repeat-containing protein at3g22690 [Phtheirospermum japonicum]|uniref:Pentatricopeptide repeat-containing protein at3g22690 n=1 Tax=Phtheirospermum japonicum TaxID=374723 RepID=A0A830BUT4_9LAMI|nr:pentatricopeptide repeat-containing protein at3g22690 [Phtheirospermum japonicum]